MNLLRRRFMPRVFENVVLQRMISVPLVCGSFTGCASTLERNFDRAIQIEDKCTAIQEAVPVEDKELKSTLFNAVALQLIGTCLENDAKCLSSDVGVATLHDVSTSVDALRKTLETQKLDIQQLEAKGSQNLRDDASHLKSDFESVRADIESRQKNVVGALEALRSELVKARDTVGGPLSSACSLRSECVRRLSIQIRKNEADILKAINELKTALSKQADSEQDVAKLALRARQLFDLAKSQHVAVADELGHRKVIIGTSVKDVKTSLAQLGTRLENGSQALTRLLSGDVEDAAMDLMAAKLYSKAAERTLALIDRMLAQIDHTIDKMDEHFYGGATISTQLFSDALQSQFDRVYQNVIAPRFVNKSAKLAFASAACQRLGTGSNPAIQNQSIFSPFLYATLINVELDAKAGLPVAGDDRRVKLAELRKENEKASAKESHEMLKVATTALQEEAKANKAPTMIDQVALCAGIEQELGRDTGNVGDAVRQKALAMCGNAIMESTIQAGLNDGKAGVAVLPTVDKAIQLADRDAVLPNVSKPTTSDAEAWRRAMEAVLAGMRSSTGVYDAICRRIEARIHGARCDGFGDRAIVEIGTSFPDGQSESNVIEERLASLADLLNEQAQTYDFLIEGFASHNLPRCQGSLREVEQLQCGVKRNADLAYDRADWTARVLKARMQVHYGSGSQVVGKSDRLSYDAPIDRRVRISFWTKLSN